MRNRSFVHALTTILIAAAAGCAPAADADEDGPIADNVLSFEELEALTPRDPHDGAYLVEGDIPLHGKDALRAYFEEGIPQPGQLRVSQCYYSYTLNDEDYCSSMSTDVVWTSTQKLALSYCVSTSFGSRYDDVVTAMADAAVSWEATTGVMFVHRSDQDASCTNTNGNVIFDVSPTSGTTYNARAFFPSYPRSRRELRIDTGNAWNDACKSATGILTHELGHVLGFTHEHAGLGCTTETTGGSRAVTSYDVSSVMHYARCAGKGCVDYSISALDESGSRAIYGAPGTLGLERWITKAGGYQSTGQWVAGDFNGDGKADMALAWSNGGNYSIDAYISNGAGFGVQRWITKAGGYVSSGQWLAGDFNGDGKADMAVVWNDGGNYSVDAYISNGASFGVQRWITRAGGYASSGQWVAGDFNGDGKTDLAMAWNDSGNYSIDAYISNGAGFGVQRWITRAGGYASSGKWVAGDFDGNGKADMAMAWSDGGHYSVDAYISSGASFGVQRWLTKEGDDTTTTSWLAGDFDGDGKADMGKTWKDDGNISIDAHVSFGSGFALQRWATQDGGYASTGQWVTGDFDADGYDDVAMVWSDSGNYSVDLHKR